MGSGKTNTPLLHHSIIQLVLSPFPAPQAAKEPALFHLIQTAAVDDWRGEILLASWIVGRNLVNARLPSEPEM